MPMKALVILALTVAVSACSSGRSAEPAIPLVSQAAVPRIPAVGFRIKVPFDRKQTQNRRLNPQYVSPATQSIQITVNPGPDHKTIEADLSASNPNCTVPQAISYLTCTVPLSLSAGSYTANFVTYDKPGGTNGGGKTLSQTNGFPFTVTANNSNQVSVALGGIPSTLRVAATLASQQHVLSPAGSADLGIVGIRPQTLTAFALDADGDIIVGPGSPAVSATSSDPSAIAVTQPNASSPNTVGVRVLQFNSSPVALTFSAKPSGSSGSNAIALTQMTQTLPELFVGSDATDHAVNAFADLANSAPIAVPQDDITLPTGAGNILSMAADTQGNIWVDDLNDGKVYAIAPGASTPIAGDTIDLHTDYAPGIAFDKRGALYILDQATQTISQYTPGNSTPNFSITDSPTLAIGQALTYDPIRDVLWVSNAPNTPSSATAYDPIQRARVVADSFQTNSPLGIAIDLNDDVWTLNYPAETATGYAKSNGTWNAVGTIPAIPGALQNIAVDPFGNLIFTKTTGGFIAYRTNSTTPLYDADFATLSSSEGTAFVP